MEFHWPAQNVPRHPIKNAEYWIARADDARAAADQLKDPEAKRVMTRVAHNCDQMAKKTDIPQIHHKDENPD